MEEAGNVANQQWPWATEQQGRLAGTELTKDLGGLLNNQNCIPQGLGTGHVSGGPQNRGPSGDP